jgi:CRP-like cAMP-binding protein
LRAHPVTRVVHAAAGRAASWVSMHDYWHISGFDLLSELPDAQLAELRAASITRRFAKNATIFGPSKAPTSVYMLEKGRVRIYRASRDGLETTFGYIKPGEVFGELAALGQRARESYAQAIEPSDVLLIPVRYFEKLLSAEPSFGFEVAKQVGDRLKRIESRVQSLVFRPVRDRLSLCLLDLSDRFGVSDGDGLRLDMKINQSELATLIGATRQTVNLCLRDLESDGLISRRSSELVLPNVEALRSEVDG